MEKQKHAKLYLFLMALVFATACAGSAPTQGLSISVQADPQSVFTGKQTRIFIDVVNSDVKTYNNVNVELFDRGRMAGAECSGQQTELRPGSLFTTQCVLDAPQSIEIPVFRNDVHARALYDSTVSGIAVVEAMTEDEYNRLRDAGKLPSAQTHFSFYDKNMKVDVELGENPFVFIAERKYFMHIKISNAGNGFVEEIVFDESKNIADKLGIVKCSNAVLRAVGREFPTITCELTPQPQRLEGYDIGININYVYDVRASTSVDIVR